MLSEGMQQTLNNVSKEFGNIDEHVANSRGLELSHMVSTLSPSQIDACAQSVM